MKLTRFAFSLVLFLTVMYFGMPSILAQNKPKCQCFVPQINFYGIWGDTSHNSCVNGC